MYKHVISLKLQWNSLNICIKKVIRTKEKKRCEIQMICFSFQMAREGKVFNEDSASTSKSPEDQKESEKTHQVLCFNQSFD